MSVGAYLARRLALLVISLFVVLTLAFLLVALIPSNPAATLAGPYASPAQVAEVEHQLGLDQPLGVRYVRYITSLLRADLGTSLYGPQLIADQIGLLFPSTLELVLLSMLLAVVVGLTLGVGGTYYQGRWPDVLTRAIVAITQAVPDFVMAVILIFVLYYVLRLVPGPVGQLALSAQAVPRVTGFLLVDSLLAGKFDTFRDAVMHVILPVLTLGLAMSAVFAQISRSTLAKAMQSETIDFARASGLSEWQVIRYALLIGRTTIVTSGAILFGRLVGGTAIIETVFNWNGVSQWAVQSMLRQDYPAIQGFILLAGFITLAVYIALDVVTSMLDPRIVIFRRS